MAFLPSLPEKAHLADVFTSFPAMVKPLLELSDVLLRAPSPLSIGEREMIAAFVSGLNACQFCHAAHKISARAFGIGEQIIAELLEDIETANVSEKLKPLLTYVKKLTLTSSRMTEADAKAVLDAGWDEQAFHDAVAVCALFNFMNRLLDGMGIKEFDMSYMVPDEVLRQMNYSDWGHSLGVMDIE